MQSVVSKIKPLSVAYALFVLALLTFAPPAAALDTPKLSRLSAEYSASLRDLYKTGKTDAKVLSERAETARQGEQWTKAIKAREELAGRNLGGYKNWIELARDWQTFRPTSVEALAASYQAYLLVKDRRDIRNQVKIDTLLTLGGILRDKNKIIIGKFDDIGNKEDMIEAQIISEKLSIDAIKEQGARNKLSGRAKQFYEALKKEKINKFNLARQFQESIKLTRNIYHHIYKNLNLNQGVVDSALQEELDKKLFTIKENYGEDGEIKQTNLIITKKHAEICVPFNLPLLSDEEHYRGKLKLVELEKRNNRETRRPAPFDLRIEQDTACLVGLHYGKTYELVVEKGLTSKAGVALVKDFKEQVVIPDRPPTVGFVGDAFILPQGGAGMIPMKTVNLDHVDLELLRVSDRKLHRRIALGEIGDSLDRDAFTKLRDHFSEVLWDGWISVKDPQNETVTTNLALRKLLDEREKWLQKETFDTLKRRKSSQKKKIGDLVGRFHADTMSPHDKNSYADEPALYALIAKRRAATGCLSNSNETDATTGKPFCDVAVQWFVTTDIGLTYYKSYSKLYVAARSLATGEAKMGVKLQLITANNRVLAQQATDSRGIAEFSGRLARGTVGNRLAAIAASKSNDFSFVEFRRDVFDLSDRGVAGRPAPLAYDAYIYTDRGIYRPGGKVRTTVLLKNVDGVSHSRLPPLTVKLKAANGKVIDQQMIADSDWRLGGASIILTPPKTSPLGYADIEVYLTGDKLAIGKTTIQVDYFRPYRAQLIWLEPKKWSVKLAGDDEVEIAGSGQADYLYGRLRSEQKLTDAPAAGLNGEVELLIEKADSPFAGCYDDKGFTFVPTGEDFSPSLRRFSLFKQTDDKGIIKFNVRSTLASTNHPLQARLQLSLFDEGGRAASRGRIVPIRLNRTWLGARHTISPTPDTTGRFDVAFDLMALGKTNRPRRARITYKLSEERSDYIWYEAGGVWKYQNDLTRALVQQGVVRAKGGRAAPGCQAANAGLTFKLGLGRFILEIADEDGNKTSVRFATGWSSAASKSPTPDALAITASSRDYKPRQDAVFKIDSPFDGHALIAIANDRVHEWVPAVVKNGFVKVTLPIPPKWAGQSFYALATVFRSNADGTRTRGPSRAVGAVYFNVDHESRKFDVELGITKRRRILPDSKLAFDIHVPGVQGEAYAVVYAVDIGLIDITSHSLPKPFDHFFGQRRLGLDILDNYSRVLFDEPQTGDRSGGDRPRRVFLNDYLSDKIVAQSTGPLKIVNGKARVTFEPFDFDGRVRIAAVAWTDSKVGHASHELTVRSSIVSQLKLPSVLMQGDKARVPLTLHNLLRESGEYRVALDLDGPIEIREVLTADGKTIQLDQDRRFALELPWRDPKLVYLKLAVGKAKWRESANIKVSVESPEADGSEQVTSKEWHVALRPQAPARRYVVMREIRPGRALDLDEAVIKRLIGDRYLDGLVKVRAQVTGSRAELMSSFLPDQPQDPAKVLQRLVWSGMLQLRRMRAQSPSVQLVSRPGKSDTFRMLQNRDLPGHDLRTPKQDKILRNISVNRCKRACLAEEKCTAFTYNEKYRWCFLKSGAPQSAPHKRATSGIRQMAVVPQDPESESSATPVADAGAKDRADDLADGGNDVNRLIRDIEALQDNEGLFREFRLLKQRALPLLGESLNYVKNDGNYEPVWLSALALDFLRLAHMNGFNVNHEVYWQGLTTLKDVIRGQLNDVISEADLSDTYEVGETSDVSTDEVGETSDESTESSEPETPALCHPKNLYAVFVLAPTGLMDKEDIELVAKTCVTEDADPIEVAMTAAAVSQFGIAERAATIIRANFIDGDMMGGEIGGPEDFAMLLAFLSVADAPKQVRNKLVAELLEHKSVFKDPSSKLEMWLARSMIEDRGRRTAPDPQLKLSLTPGDVFKHTEASVVHTPFMELAEIARKPIRIVNRGRRPVHAALVLRGFPSESDDGPEREGGGDYSIERRVYDRHGNDVLKSGREVKTNEILYVILEGTAPGNEEVEAMKREAAQEKKKAEERGESFDESIEGVDNEGEYGFAATNYGKPVILLDPLPSGVEILDLDVMDLFQHDTNLIRSNLADVERVGDLRMAERRPDRFIATVAPTSAGKFRVGYAVRATTAGSFTLPPALVEDLDKPWLFANTEAARLTIGPD